MLPEIGAGLVGAGALTTYYLAPWLKQDLLYIHQFLKFRKALTASTEAGLYMVDVFEASVRRDPQKTFIWYEGVAYSYGMVDTEATKVARFVETIGLKCGDTVAMMIYNSPEFVWTFYGLLKMGIQISLLNTNLRSKSLQHCVAVSQTKVVIVGQDLNDAIDSISEFLKDEGYSVWIQGKEVIEPYQSMDEVLVRMNAEPIDPKVRSSIKPNDPTFFIFTSGTTGLPKAAIVTIKRPNGGSAMIPVFCQATKNDVIYLPMPLYHSSALVIGLAGAANVGCAVVLRQKFSAKEFWEDCRRYDVTICLYIGELLRYLVNRPQQPNDKDHKVRLIIGNGLRPEIWTTFRDRFNIRQIREFYASTEGAGMSINLGDIPGSIGRCSPIMRKLYPVRILKFDYETEMPVRGRDGRCIQVGPGESGLFVCAIEAGKFEFDGYKGNKALTEKKILQNVFKEGDAYFNSGDLLRVDEMYNLYFVDRVGDTFRWKGENVSTNEVGAVLADDDQVHHVNVYGVQIPGCDGRAGMAAMTMNEGCHVTDDFLSNVYKKVKDNLPGYARPLFLRIQSEIETTSTFKYIKTHLQRDGFNPHLVKEPLYRFDPIKATYTPLDSAFYSHVMSGKSKL